MRVAIIHDWLIGMRGGERCLEELLRLFPNTDIYTLFYDRNGVSEVINSKAIYSSTANQLPGVRRYYRHLLPLYPLFVRNLEKKLAREHARSAYDLVISVSHCAAKNVRVPDGLFHLCYCLTPMRYIWDQYDAYFSNSRLEPLIRQVAARLRKWDVRCAARVDSYLGISEFVCKRIQVLYGREARVVYPPVRNDWLKVREREDQGEGFLCVSALVPYKNVSLIVDAFNRLNLPLTIVGSGPEEASLRARANNKIKFIRYLSENDLAALYRRSKAFIFAAEEDFGMTPVEMLAAGRPVICLGKGGTLETVESGGNSPSGVHFYELTTDAICEAVKEFLRRQGEFTVDNCVHQATKFSLARFEAEFIAALRSHGLESRERLSASAS